MTYTGYQLKLQGYLEEKAVVGGFGSVIKLNNKSQRWLKKADRSSIVPSLTFTPSPTLLAMEKPRPQQLRYVVSLMVAS